MSSTIVEQLAVNSGGHAGPTVSGLYHVHSWRPWMSMYGLRLRTQGTAQPEVRQVANRGITLLASVLLSCFSHSCRHTGCPGSNSEVVAT